MSLWVYSLKNVNLGDINTESNKTPSAPYTGNLWFNNAYGLKSVVNSFTVTRTAQTTPTTTTTTGENGLEDLRIKNHKKRERK